MGYISHRLYRQHCSPTEDYAIKDLRLLGRDLSRTIIVDNLAENFSQTPENGIWVESWYDDLECTVLPTLQKFLEELVVKEVDDVRSFLTPNCKDLLYQCFETQQKIPSISQFPCPAASLLHQ
jgi:TFIIF-interacting CTD phosphatase-like protein